MVLAQFWYLPECPRKAVCMGGKKNPKLWGWSLEEAKQAVKHHLMRSSYHYCTEEEAEEEIAAFLFEEGTMEVEDAKHKDEEEEEAAAASPGQARKKQRLEQSTAPSSSSSRAATGLDTVAIARVVSETVRQTLGQMPAAQPQPQQHAAQFAATLAALGTSGNFRGEQTIELRMSQLQAIIDSAQRAGHAARQAQILSQSAARAFEAEAQTLDACRDYLQSLQR